MIATAQDKVILCVEDEQDLLSDIMEELAEAGYQAIGAKSGSEALEKLTESPPDLILCDISMPGLTGFDVLKSRAGKRRPVCPYPLCVFNRVVGPTASGRR